jgi:hypothetical protein
VPESTNVQGIIYDADGSLRPSLLALVEQEGSSDTVLRSWSNSGAGFTVSVCVEPTVFRILTRRSQAPPLQESSEACTLASPHSSAFIDIDGDCLPGARDIHECSAHTDPARPGFALYSAAIFAPQHSNMAQSRSDGLRAFANVRLAKG